VTVGLQHATYYPWRARLYENLASDGQQIQPLIADSHNSNTYKRIVKLLGGDRVDLLFIDGDHTLEGVRQDFEMYSPLVRKGGMTAFHDIVPLAPEWGSSRVDKFWSTLKESFNCSEIIDTANGPWGGIGILILS
jgi:hypothetical protein